MFKRLLDQAAYYNCSLYKTGKVRCRELISGGVESVSNEEGEAVGRREEGAPRMGRAVARRQQSDLRIPAPNLATTLTLYLSIFTLFEFRLCAGLLRGRRERDVR